jgi:ABC-type nitrate/sulfonate/bicarbonate transport system substrate-binding protein
MKKDKAKIPVYGAWLAALAVISLLVVAGSSGACSSADRLPLGVGITHNEADALIYIAEEQGLFTRNGLEVSIQEYSSGSAAVAGMQKGEVDLATASEFVVVNQAFQGQSLQTIGVVSEVFAVHLMARTDQGIRSVTDLEGKKVGVPMGTLAQFNLGRFLDLNGMHDKPLTLENIDISRSDEALVNGEVDAVQTWGAHVMKIKEILGDKAVDWPSDNSQPQFKNVTATGDWLTQHPEVVKRFLKSLSESNQFISGHPDQAKTIVQKWLQYDSQYLESVWKGSKFSLSLNQALLLAMEDEARWMIENNLTPEREIPDFSGYIYLDGLKGINPEAVNIR